MIAVSGWVDPVGGHVGGQAVADPDEGALDQVIAEKGAGEGHEPVKGPGLERSEAGGIGSEVGDKEELLPEVEAVGEPANVAQNRGFEEAAEPALRVEHGSEDEKGGKPGDEQTCGSWNEIVSDRDKED